MLTGKIEGDKPEFEHEYFYGGYKTYTIEEQLNKIADERKRAIGLGFCIGRTVTRKTGHITGIGKIINYATDMIKGWGGNRPAPIIVEWGSGTPMKYDMNYNSDDLLLVKDGK